jgi:DNA recombination protein RmuC
MYESLLNAYELGNPDEVELASKNLETTIRKMAKDIRDKYIDPPHTTDFALLFLPFEGIYAEVVRRSALIDQLQSEYKVAVAGPSTLTAYLNSLQMGFRTLALQKRSSEVWQVLGAVKTEFEKFGGLLEKTQKNIHAASDSVDELLGKRTRAISRKLKQVESLPAAEAQKILPEVGSGEDEEE